MVQFSPSFVPKSLTLGKPLGMNIDLSGKRALVCGASQGIGKATAWSLAMSGAAVTLLARDKEALAELRDALPALQGQKHHILPVDLLDTSALKDRLNDYLGKGNEIHILVNNSGGPAAGALIHEAPEKFEEVFRQHLISAHILTQCVLDGMIAAGYGRIINVISTSVKAPLENLGVSNTIRGAVANWSKTLAAEVGRWGITVNNVLPGATSTGRLTGLIANKARKTGKTEEEIAKAMQQEIPLNRFAQPEELAAAITFLASPQAAYITGVNLPVDGGRLKNL